MAGVIQSGRFTTSAFTPTSISGCVLWLDAQDASTFTYSSGSVVSQWNDKSSAANHVSQATTNKQPTRTASSLGAYEGVVFDGSNDALVSGSNSPDVPYTLFMVAKRVGTGMTVSGFIDLDGRLTYVVSAADLATWNGSTSLIHTSTTSDFNNPFLLTITATSTALSSRLNGVSKLSGSSFTSAGPAKFSLASEADGTNQFGNNSLGEIIVYDSVLSGTDISTVESYLNTKWGL